ncbi:MAG: DUF4190 domain-containing protein [Pseudonocardiaceae bacterium]
MSEINTPGEPRDSGAYLPPGSYGQGPVQRRNGFGIAALILGLLALVLSWTIIGGIILGALALIFGVLGRGRAKRGEATNGGMSIAGIVLGVVGLLIAIALVAFGVSLINSPAGRDYQQCIQQSGGDPVRIDQCASEFGSQIGGG